MGGLGVRKVSSLALLAYLASAASTASLQNTKQSFWDSLCIIQARQQVEESKSDVTQKAKFLAASAPHSGDWSLAPP